MTDSHIHVTDGVCTAYVGLDATHLFRAKTIMISIKYTNKGMKMTRGMTMTKLLKMASEYTGKKYKRTESETAMEDLRQWCLAMEMALPVVHN
jgi:hypothetical protein